MDNLVLWSVARALGAGLLDAVLASVAQESPRRIRLTFARDERTLSCVLSVDPANPWIGRPVLRAAARRKRQAPGPLAAACARELVGRRLIGLVKPEAWPQVALEFSGGRSLQVDFSPRGLDLRLVGPAGEALASARSRPVVPRSETIRIDVFRAEAPAIDDALEHVLAEGRPVLEALGRRLSGIGREGLGLLLDEHARTGRRLGELVSARLGDLRAGRLEPVILAAGDPAETQVAGRLLPWAPAENPPGLVCHRREDPAATAGLYHQVLDRALEARARRRGLLAVLDQEIARTHRALTRAEEDRERFRDPDRWRRMGEALLAGLTGARREVERVWVDDPYAPGRERISIPAEPGLPLPQVAARLFARHRRARRGFAQSGERAEALARRRSDLMRLREDEGGEDERADTAALEAAMREQGIPVGLERPARRGGPPAPARLEGVRMIETRDGTTVLVGRTARDNQRLTFKLAGPEDFWFHAAGRPGAHVIVRNEGRRERPAESVLAEAASLAAWFSDARGEGLVEVHWTRRKYVRRVRGAPAGTVSLKRHETLRVRATPPAEDPG